MDLSFFQAVILAITEGISEFLPISSTGHMVLVADLLKIPQTDFVKTFEIFIQSGAILAVVALFAKELLTDKDTFIKTAVAFLPTAVIGLVLYKFIKSYLIGNTAITLWALLLGGIGIILVELYFKGKGAKLADKEIRQLSYPKAAAVGLIQALSVIPGVSRSAATIIGGRVMGLNREASVKFSFYLAIPTLLAATGLDLVNSINNLNKDQFGILGIGIVATFIVALLVIKWFLGYVRKYSLIPFGIYRIILAVAFYLVFLR